MPRLTTVQRLAIASPINGLLVYDTNLKGVYSFDGTWDCLNTPAGTVQHFANVTAPRGYLTCDGQNVSTTTYPELFNAIGYAYGVADLSRACVAMAIDGLLIESHPDPKVAKSDADQQLNFDEFTTGSYLIVVKSTDGKLFGSFKVQKIKGNIYR